MGEELKNETKVALITRLGYILQTLKYETSDNVTVAIKEIQTLQSEIEEGLIVPF